MDRQVTLFILQMSQEAKYSNKSSIFAQQAQRHSIAISGGSHGGGPRELTARPEVQYNRQTLKTHSWSQDRRDRQHAMPDIHRPLGLQQSAADLGLFGAPFGSGSGASRKLWRFSAALCLGIPVCRSVGDSHGLTQEQCGPHEAWRCPHAPLSSSSYP